MQLLKASAVGMCIYGIMFVVASCQNIYCRCPERLFQSRVQYVQHARPFTLPVKHPQRCRKHLKVEQVSHLKLVGAPAARLAVVTRLRDGRLVVI